MHKDKVWAMWDFVQNRIAAIHRKATATGFLACAKTVLKPVEKRVNSTRQDDAQTRIVIGFRVIVQSLKNPGKP
jgi:hypothetical protein